MMIEPTVSGRGCHGPKTICCTIGHIDVMRAALIGRDARFDMLEALRVLQRISDTPFEAWVRSIPTTQTM